MPSVFDRLLQLSAKRYNVDVATLGENDDVFEKLGIDSFEAAALMSELELEFDVEIPDYELQGIRTFGQLAAAIQKRT
jgi:acyl carrier protein